MNYSEARALMSRARYPANGKPLASNARLYERDHNGTPAYAVKLYETDIVKILKDGTYILRTGGWETTQTRDGIETYAPVPHWSRILKVDGQYWIRTRPNDADPEPERIGRQVEKPFWATSPGPAPVRDAFNCLAGSTVGRTTRMSFTLNPDLVALRSYTLQPGDRPERESRAPAERGSGRDVVAFLKKNERHVRVSRLITRVTHYTVEHEYGSEQCPHCRRVADRDYAWRSRSQAWESFVRNMDEHGGQAGWLEAARADLRRVKAENRAWVEWDKRNRIPLNGTRIGSDGYPLKMEVDAYFKAERRAERDERRRQREIEAAARHERHMARLKSGYMQRRAAREPKFVRIANQIREDLEQTHLVLATGAWTEPGDE